MAPKKLAEGSKAPDFTAESTEGGQISLSDYRGKIVVLYFYPKDNTSGCTKQACSFRDANDFIKKRGAVVLGVSKDSIKSHENFTQKHELNFPLISDPEKKINEAYGTWVEKTRCGKTSMGTERSTFVIDGEGIIRKIWRKVKVAGHTEEVLNFIKTL
jgi:thioredoxin-dependent peroxiredoxin